MGGEIRVESVYGEGSCFSFYVMQKVERYCPSVTLAENENLWTALWLGNKEKARVISRKIAKMGVHCDILAAPDNLAQYSHVFFDFAKCGELDIPRLHCPDTQLIAISPHTPDTLDALELPPGVKVVSTPLTCLTIAQLLGSKAAAVFTESLSGTETSSLQVRDAHLLVVDDNEINLVIAENVLMAYGAAVSTADSGAEAVEMVQQNDYDIVFMDHMMPEMDGVDATKIIRALPGDKYRDLPIVALTANVVGDVYDLFRSSGMNDFLSKPLEMHEIERVLREWLPREKWSVAQPAAN
jgi:CheY-like chemotaxis protein